MNFSPEQCLTFIRYYLDVSCGAKLHGISHNLNNFVHVLNMQLTLLDSILSKRPDSSLREQARKLNNLNQGTKKLMRAIELLARRNFYLQEEIVSTSPKEFLSWVRDFWQNDLFFKHNINCHLDFDSDTPVLELPAFALTFCVEQALANAVEAYKFKDPDTKHDLDIKVLPYGKGVELQIISTTDLTLQDPWEPWQTTKPGHLGLGLTLIQFLTSRLNWSASLSCQNGVTRFSLQIRERKSLFKS
ncbi:hypothetical protein [Desulfovulcanus sp.]